MFAPPTSDERRIILSLIARAPDGVPFDRIAQSQPTPPDKRRLRQWLGGFIDEGLILADGEGRDALYLAVDPESLLKLYGAGDQPVNGSNSGAATSGGNGSRSAPPGAPSARPTPGASGQQAVLSDTAADPDFPAMLEMAIGPIVTWAMDSSKAAVILQSHALRNHKDPAGVAAYVAYGLDSLAALTPADAQRHNLTLEQFSRWRSRFVR